MPAALTLLCALAGFAAGYLGSVILISSGFPLISIIAGAAAAFFLPGRISSLRKRRERRIFLRSFCDMLNSMSASFASGRNLNGALTDTEADMARLYGHDCLIAPELSRIGDGLRNGGNITVLLSEFADRTGFDDVKLFSDTVGASLASGGDLGATVAFCREIICEKISSEQEIEAAVSSGKNELMIMSVMPFAVSALTGVSFESEGRLRLIAGLAAAAVFAAAIAIGRKIINIKV